MHFRGAERRQEEGGSGGVGEGVCGCLTLCSVNAFPPSQKCTVNSITTMLFTAAVKIRKDTTTQRLPKKSDVIQMFITNRTVTAIFAEAKVLKRCSAAENGNTLDP